MRPKMINVQRLAPFSGRSLDIGVVLDLMIHDIDMLLTLVPAPVRQVEALGVSLLGGNEDLAQARLTFANGCVVHLSASRVHTSAVRRMDVWSAEGYAGVDFHQRQLTLVQPSQRLRSLREGRHTLDAATLASLRLDPFSNLLQHSSHDCTQDGPDQLTRELNDFVAAGFDPRLFPEIDFQRGRVRPRTLLDFSVGADLRRQERVSINLQFDIQNLTNELFLYNFESVFSGTHVGYPRLFSGKLSFRFK